MVGSFRQLMSLLGQYDQRLFQEVFALLHRQLSGFDIADWAAVTVRCLRLQLTGCQKPVGRGLICCQLFVQAAHVVLPVALCMKNPMDGIDKDHAEAQICLFVVLWQIGEVSTRLGTYSGLPLWQLLYPQMQRAGASGLCQVLTSDGISGSRPGKGYGNGACRQCLTVKPQCRKSQARSNGALS